MSILDVFEESKEENRFPPFIAGVVVGIVTDIDDPDKLGRIKVKLTERDTSDYETDFIRVMTPMTGNQWGMFFFPEVGDEVVVSFSHGDISRPYVLGSLWNQNLKPPVEIENKENKIRKIKTKNGHEIIFHDEKGKDSIQIITPKKLEIQLDEEKMKILIQDEKGKNKVEIDSKNGMITMEAEKKVQIVSGNSKMLLDANSKKVIIESGQSIQLKSQQISIEASSTLDLKASGGLTAKSDGATNIKGSVVKIN